MSFVEINIKNTEFSYLSGEYDPQSRILICVHRKSNTYNDKQLYFVTEMFPTKKWMDFCQLVEHTFIWIIYHMIAEAAASFHGNQINIVNETLQNLSEKSKYHSKR